MPEGRTTQMALAAALLLSAALALPAQVAQMGGSNNKALTGKMIDLDQQRQTKDLMGEQRVGDRTVRAQVEFADFVTALPAVMPRSLGWEANGLKWGGTWPLVTAEGVYVVTADRKLHALDPATGKERWVCKLKSDAVSQLVLGPGLLLALDNGSLVSVEPGTGKLRWTASLDSASGGRYLDEEVQPVTQPVLAGDLVLVGSFASSLVRTTGKLYALDGATGQRRWEKELPHGVTQAPVVRDGVVWAGGGDHYGAYSLKDGHEQKAFHLRKGPLGPAVGRGSHFFFGSKEEVFAVDVLKQEVAPLPAFPLGKGLAAMDARVAADADGLRLADATAATAGWGRAGALAGVPVVNDNRVFALTKAKALTVSALPDGKPLATLALSAEPYYPRPLVTGNQALVLEKLDKGFLLEAFQGPAWRRTWQLTLQDQLVTVPTFTAKGFLIWTLGQQLRMIH